MNKPSEYLLKNLAINVRKYRKKIGLSQEQFAEKCGLHRTYIGAVERAERNVTLSTLEILSKALDISISHLLNDEDIENE